MADDLISRQVVMDAFRSYMVEHHDREKCICAENCETCEIGCLWRKVVAAVPSANAVEVVRCKECKYQIKEWHTDNRMISEGYYTYGCDRNFHCYSSNAVNGRDNEFCSHGERKEDNATD